MKKLFLIFLPLTCLGQYQPNGPAYGPPYPSVVSIANTAGGTNNPSNGLNPGAGGNNNIFTNVALTGGNNQTSSIRVTNDTTIVGPNLILALDDSVNETYIAWYINAAIAGYIGVNPTHGGGASVANSELGIVANGPGLAILPNGGSAAGYGQLGQTGQQVIWYVNSDGNPNLTAGSSVLVFRTSLPTNGVLFKTEPAIFSNASTNINQWELDITADVPIESIGNAFQSGYVKSNQIPGIQVYAGTNGPVPYHGVKLSSSFGGWTNNWDINFNTNTLVVTSAGVSNPITSSVSYLVSVSAGSAMAVKDTNGNQFLAPAIGNSFLLKPGFRFTGTTVSAIAQQFP